MDKPFAYAIVLKDVIRILEKSKKDLQDARANYHSQPSESNQKKTLEVKLKMSEDTFEGLQKTFDTLKTIAVNYVKKKYIESIMGSNKKGDYHD